MDADSEIEAPKGESRPVTSVENTRSFRRMYHAASGASILGIDWILFSGNILSGGMATFPTMVLGLVLGGLSTALIQRFVAKDSTLKSLSKAFVAGLVVGAPTPVAGTVLGGVVLAVSGLSTTRLGSKLGLR